MREAFEDALAAAGGSLAELGRAERARRGRLPQPGARSRATCTSRARRSRITSTGSRRRGSSGGVLDPADRRVRRLELTDAGRGAPRADARRGDQASGRSSWPGSTADDRPRSPAASTIDPGETWRRGFSRRPSVWPSTRKPVDDERPQVERHRAVGDPLEVVGELLGHRGLVAAAHLREARSARAGRRAAASRRAGRSRARRRSGPGSAAARRTTCRRASTFQSCGISSSCDAFSQRPIRVYSASVRRTSSSPR